MKQLRKLSKIILLAGITIWLTSCSGGEGGTAPYVDEGDTAPPADEDQSGIPHLSSIRRGHTATLLNDGTVLITGGSNSRGSYLDSAEVYDPVSDSFTTLASTMTGGRSNHTATLLNDGTVLITGGSNSRGSHLDSAEVYDPVSDSFTALISTPKPRSDLAE